ncbi:MAG: helix-turn-helix transcriptional regulator [Spirochaetaceae bacterium]|jgi:transcriptional regulator with XRE-family HTH domain|nr:helix-turn-helix transcriptional regulator [Spirochaetaceae bacterium]
MTDIRELLAKNIKEYRKLRGFSQENLAEKAGTSTTHIGMIEIGKKFPSTQMLVKIAGALGIDTPELFSTGKACIVQIQNVSMQKLYQDILSDFEGIVSKRIASLV